VLSGTERVFIDGRLLNRGQEYDYTINYNTAELIFTAKNLITKDVRIVVEFQYSDQNYARSLFQAGTHYTSEKLEFWLNAYSEQDARNQTIQQDLSLDQKQLLSTIGDSLYLARTSSINKIGYLETENLYKLVDSLGIDSVLVFSVNKDSALYRASFAFVGPNNGNYVFSSSNALGKIFRWVAPINGIPQGNYEPARIIITPKQKKMFSSGFSYKIRKNISIESEFAYTENDLNTFSRLDSKDDKGYSNRTRLNAEKPFARRDSIYRWTLKSYAEVEVLNQHFSPIEQYRSVEFDRDWNTRGKNYLGNQLATTLNSKIQHHKNGEIGAELTQFDIGTDYEGYKSRLFGRWNQNGFVSTWDGSYLSSRAIDKNEFLRHKIYLSKNIKKIRLGYKDDLKGIPFEETHY
jgi:hypothetical protein